METNRRGLFKRKWIIAILVYVGLFAMCCIALYVVPSVKGMLERTYTAEHGTIDVGDQVSAFIVRDETVYIAAQDSTINQLAETDKLVKAGTRVVELTPTDESEEEAASDSGSDDKSGKDAESKDKAGTEGAGDEEEESEEVRAGKYTSIVEELGDAAVSTKKGKTKIAGYVSYYVDGAEAKLSTASIDSLTYEDLKDLTDRRAIKVPAKKCGKGYPVFKVVRNSKWYLVYYISNDDAAKYTVGETVSIDINGDPVAVSVYSVEEGKKDSKIVLSCKTFFDGFLEERSLKTTVTVLSAEGLVLEDDSIVEDPDGRKGVFVINKLGEHVFTPVRIKADNGSNCVVYADIYADDEGNYVETISDYDEIIAVPSEEDLASLKKAAKEEAAEEGTEAGAGDAAAEGTSAGSDEGAEAGASEGGAKEEAASDEGAEAGAAEEAAADGASEGGAAEEAASEGTEDSTDSGTEGDAAAGN